LDKVDDLFIEKEVIYTIGCSQHTILVQPMKDLLKDKNIDSQLRDEIEDALYNLSLV
jgi:hypothetical protein